MVSTATAAPVLPKVFDCVAQTLAVKRALSVFLTFAVNQLWRVVVQNVAPLLRKVWFKRALRTDSGVFRPLLLIR